MLEKNKLLKKPNHQDVIPATARIIKIMNVRNPYFMRAYEIAKHIEEVDRINRELLKFVRTDHFITKKDDAKHPKPGDMILVQSRNLKNGMIELPSFLCRGLISYVKKNHKCNVLLVDHGNSIELARDEFCVVPQDFIHEKYLTKTVGLCNVLPIHMKKNISNEYTGFVVEEWTEEAIRYAKDLLVASKTVYFDHLVTDENGREYGEFYLVIDDIVMPLSEALIINYYAISLTGDLLQLIENKNDVRIRKAVGQDVIIFAKFSTDRRSQIDKTQSVRHNVMKDSEKVLIYSTTRYGVLNNISELGFPSSIHKKWNAYIKSSRPSKLQSYILLPIKNGLNTVAIGPPQCGKTTGCIMSVCGLAVMHQQELSSGANQPLALILCASSSEAINIQSLCATFLQNSNNVKFVAAFNGKTERSVTAGIYNGCHIVVATPRYLVRFLNNNKGLLSFDKLSYLFIDNADVILDKYYNSMGELFKKHQIIDNRTPKAYDRPLLQMIMTSTNWTSNIKKCVSLLMYNPYICITSFIEAIMFKSIHPKLYIIRSIHKKQKVLDILQDNYTTLRTMVVCTNMEEAEELNAFLHLTKQTLLIHENMKSSDLHALQETWKACVHGLYPVLICTDVILSELSFTNIQWLIHYSVLLKLKNQFSYRFSVLLDNLTQDTANCKVTIIIDENNNVQFQSIMRMIQRMNITIPADLLENTERIAVTLERNKKDYVICDNVKSLGFCQNQNCVLRHCILPEIDTPMTSVQINDKVKLMMMYVHDTTHFSARLIEHIPHSADFKKLELSSEEYMKITFKMQEFYQNVENRKLCTSTNVGDMCVLEESIDTFKRVQIRCIRSDKSYSENVKFVDVRCIDSGIIHERIDVRKLLHIPEELLNLPTHIIEVFLANIVPCDEEYMWNECVNETVHKWLAENFDGRSYIIGKVRLHLGNTIWLDDLEIGTKLIGHDDLLGSSLKKELIGKDLAVMNEDHMSKLFHLCKTSGLTKVNGHDINTLCK